jgi:hypothetical protein
MQIFGEKPVWWQRPCFSCLKYPNAMVAFVDWARFAITGTAVRAKMAQFTASTGPAHPENPLG